MNKHSHSHCSHDLKYCEHCDIVYCMKCDREWGGHQHYWYYGGAPYTIRWSSIGTGGWEVYNNGIKVTDQSIISAYNSQPHSKQVEFKAQTGEMSSACTHHN